MTLADSVSYLESVGIHYKSAESPDLWTHLESHFDGPRRVGSKFSRLPGGLIEDMIAKGEEVLLKGLVETHQRKGRVSLVSCRLALPYVVGTEAAIPWSLVDRDRVLELIEDAGMPGERRIRVVPAAADDIPSTYEVTVTGGIYGDGHTAGYYDLIPGHADKDCVWLATPEEIEGLLREMETKIDDIAIVTRRECEELLEKARKALGR
jgi:hypothetical protein